ncbi:MAG TPA: hypothetical protein DCR14_14450 [Acidimicrobiaceae bacterium]|nr:hypothetical protein [Acidimicrobiaceae bacterium]
MAVAHQWRVLGIGVVDDLVGPGEQLRSVVVGHTEQTRDHPNRQLASDVVHPVELGHGEGPVEHLGDEVGGVRGVGVDGQLAEGRVHQLPQPSMPRRVGLEHRSPCHQGVRVQLLDLCPADLRAERSPVLVYRHHVGVPGE